MLDGTDYPFYGIVVKAVWDLLYAISTSWARMLGLRLGDDESQRVTAS